MAALLGAGVARGQDPPAATPTASGFVRHFALTAPPEVDLSTARDQVELELRHWGLDVSRCDDLRELDAELDAEIEARYPTWRHDPDLVTDKKMLTARCLPPEGTTIYYVAKVTMDVDREFGDQKRASVQIVPIGEGATDRPSYVGGYAHRPFVETVAWADVISRAMARAIGGYNEPPDIRIAGPSATTVAHPVTLDARQSWDPDGDAFVIHWSATVPACVGEAGGEDVAMARLGRRCPRGMTGVDDYPVPLAPGKGSQERVLDPPFVGRYEIRATPRTGQTAETATIRPLRVRTRRNHQVGVAAGLLPIPAGLFDDLAPAQVALEYDLFYVRRFYVLPPRGNSSELRLGMSLGLLDGHAGNFGVGPYGYLASVHGGGRITGHRGHVGVELMARSGLGTIRRSVNGFLAEPSSFVSSQVWVGPYFSRTKAYYRDGVTGRPCVGGVCGSIGLAAALTSLSTLDPGRSTVGVGPLLNVGFDL